MISTPLTPAVISKLPLGLLAYFGIKNGGQYPRFIGDTIEPIMDQLGLLLAANQIERYAVTANVTAAAGFKQGNWAGGVPFTGAAVVPAGEVWCLQSATFVLATNAGDTATVSAVVQGFQTGSATNWYRLIAPQQTQTGVLTQYYPTNVQAFPLWLSPGDNFGFIASAMTVAVGVTGSLNIAFARFAF